MSKGNINENGKDVLVAELDVEVGKHIHELFALQKYALEEVHQLEEISQELQFDYPELSDKLAAKANSIINHLELLLQDVKSIKLVVEKDKQQKSFVESVRHGVYPYFTINKVTGELRLGEADNDLAQDAFYDNINGSSNYYGHCMSDWPKDQCKRLGEQALELFKKGKTNKEIDTELQLG